MSKQYVGNGIYHVTLESTGMVIELSEVDMNEIAEESPIVEELKQKLDDAKVEKRIVFEALEYLREIEENKEIGANEIYEKVEGLGEILAQLV